MSDARPPPQVAIRIVRPYDSDEEFLNAELETVGKTSVILIGAHPRPAGIILRFEVTLQSGATVLRGEGRVLAHKERAFRGQPGLSLRFTRLDPKSKALVDRAVAMREARLSGEASSIRPPSAPSLPPVEAADRSAPPPPPPAHEPVAVPISFPAPADPALEAALTASTPEPPPYAPIEETPTPARIETSMEYSLAPSPPSIDRAIAAAFEPAAFEPPVSSEAVAIGPLSEPSISVAPTPDAPAEAVEAPKDREGILARLRERAATLSRERVQEILASRKS